MIMIITQVFWKKLLRQEGARPDFTFKKGQYPEQVLPSYYSLPCLYTKVLILTYCQSLVTFD